MDIRRHDRHVAGRIVAGCVREERPGAGDLSYFSETIRREVVRLAVAHGVAGLMPIDDWSWSETEVLAAVRRDGLRRHLQALAAVRTAADAFQGAAVPWLVFKGPVFAEHMYARPDQRSYFDLDLLVPPRRFHAALLALESAGASVLDQNWTMALERMHAEVRLRLGPTVIDLHWHLVNRRAVRGRFSIDVDGSFSRSRSIELAGRTVSTLGSVDTIVHTALHAALAGADRLAWLKDIDRCVRTDEPDWDVVLALGRRWRVELPVAGTLWRARRVLGTPIPYDVLRVLSPPAWRAVLWSAERAAPIERTMPGRSVSRLASRAAGESARSSAVSLVRRSLEAVVGDRPNVGAYHDPRNPTSLLYPSGGEPARTAYLRGVRAVAQEGRAHGPTEHVGR